MAGIVELIAFGKDVAANVGAGVHVPSMSELVLVVAREEGRWYQLAVAVMDKLFELDKGGQPYWHVSALLAGLFHLPTDSLDKRSLFGQLMEKCLIRGEYPTFDRRLLTFFEQDTNSARLRDVALAAIDVAAAQRDSAKIGFCLPVLQATDPSPYDVELKRTLDASNTLDDYARTVMAFAGTRAADNRAAVERLLARAFEAGFSRNDPVVLAAINTFLKKTGAALMVEWDLEGIVAKLPNTSPDAAELVQTIRSFQIQVNTLPAYDDEKKGTARNRLLASRFLEPGNWRDSAGS